MPLFMSKLILYVRDVARLKSFYQTHFDLAVVEEIENEWVVFNAGGVELALHLVGKPWRDQPRQSGAQSNAKIVFSVHSGLRELRERLVKAGVAMRELKRFEGFPMLMCDGEDPEGNVFQLSQPD
jgi:predicted enzyme related to lactoylglutathione lyase